MRSQQLWPLGPNFELGGTRVIATISHRMWCVPAWGELERHGVFQWGWTFYSGLFPHPDPTENKHRVKHHASSPDKKA